MTATIPEGWAYHSARLAEELDARRVYCHACGARVLVGAAMRGTDPPQPERQNEEATS